MDFKFRVPVQICFGESSINKLKEIKHKNVFILTVEPLINNGTLDSVIKKLSDNRIAYYSDILSNPTVENVNRAVRKAREHRAEIIVALGGGSVMDVGKCVSIMVNDEQDVRVYFQGSKIERAGAPLYCIPTTSGTGSEVTNVAVLSDEEQGIKRPIVSDYLYPDYALIIPSYTLTVPPHITAETGWDAFIHALEAYWNIAGNPISDAIAVRAIKLILDNIVNAYSQGDDIKVRENMSLGSLMAGVAFSETRTTALHGVSFRITSRYGISHGRACALTLLPFIKAVYESGNSKIISLCRMLGYRDFYSLYNDIRSKLISTGMAITLSEAGIASDAIDEIADYGLLNQITYLIPLNITRDRLIEILMTIL